MHFSELKLLYEVMNMRTVFPKLLKTLMCGVLLCLAFTSCENFMKGKEVRDEILETIKYNNTPSCEIIFKSDTKIGDFLTQKETAKIGYPIEIQFELNSDAYYFEKLEAVSQKDMTTPLTDYIKFEQIEIKNRIYKYKLTVLKESKDILIRPVCKLMPAVSEFYPPFAPEGYDQDTTLKISFNKPVDVQTFADILSFSKLSIYCGSENFASYYQTPYFSDDNTILYIQTVKGKNILSDTGNAIKDIDITIDLTGTKDADGLDIVRTQTVQSYSYRLNSKKDSTPPVLSECHVYSNSDSTSWNYRELTTLPCEEWSIDETEQFPQGNFSQNHVSKIYIQMDGYDDDSGIAKLCVRETRIRESNWKEISQKFAPVPVETVYDISKLTVASGNDKNKTYSIEHQLTLQWDGYSLIELWLEDYSGMKSKVSSYNIINVIESLNCMFVSENNNPVNYVAVYNQEKNSYELGLQFNQFIEFIQYYGTYNKNNANKPLNSKAMFRIELYDNDVLVKEIKHSFYNINFVQNETNFVNESLADYRFNAEHKNVMKIFVQIESGNIFEFDYEFPKVPQISYVYDDYSKILVSDQNYQSDYDYYSTTVKFLYTYQADENAEPSEIQLLNLDNFSTMANGIYNLYASRQVIYNTLSGETLYSGIIKEKPYVYYKGIQSSQTPVTSFPDFSVPQDSQINYKKNSEKVKLSVDVNFPNDGNTYAIKFSSSDNDLISYNKTVELKNGYNYSVSLLAYNAQGIVVGESSAKPLDLTVKDTFSPVFDFINDYHYQGSYSTNNSDSGSLTRIQGYAASNYLELKTNIYDYSAGKNPEYNIKSLEYYIIPDGGITKGALEFLTSIPLERIIASSVRSGKIEKTEPFIENEIIRIPFDNIPYQNYYLYFLVKDNSDYGNTLLTSVDITSTSFGHFIANIIPEVDYDDSKLLIDLPLLSSAYIEARGVSVSDTPSTDAYCYIKEQAVQNNQWVDITVPVNNFDYLYLSPVKEGNVTKKWRYEDSEDHSSKFIKINIRYNSGGFRVFAKPIIIYPDYYKSLGTVNEIVCESKNILQGANGLQIYYDKPFLAHTMYCSQKITQTSGPDEAYEWLANAQETGIEERSGNTNSTYTYTNTHYKDIPSSYYYTTIVHFADGEVSMSEIKQK